MDPLWGEHQALPWEQVRRIGFARCGGRCELCSLPLDAELWDGHHRQLRSGGGPSCPCNIVCLHPRCHTTGQQAVHRLVAAALESGHNVSRYTDPREVSVLVPPRVALLGPGPVTLTCGGTYV